MRMSPLTMMSTSRDWARLRIRVDAQAALKVSPMRTLFLRQRRPELRLEQWLEPLLLLELPA